MKRLIDWLKRNSQQQSAANTVEQARASEKVPSDQQMEGEHSVDSSFSWFGNDHADSSIFDTGSLIAEKPADKNTDSHKTLHLNDDSLSGAEEGEGFDPYNSGRFHSKNG